MSKPLILVTNDDGMIAPGIKALVELSSEFGEVVVIAPDSPQSGQGHAITITEPLRLNRVDVFEGITAYECSGTPVDCVKLAKSIILKGRNIDLCLSGINHGSNASINIIYSGTMSAAMEASVERIPSIGLSLLDYSFEADFSAAKHFTRKVIQFFLAHGFGDAKLLNVNIPKLSIHEIKGVKVCRQAEGNWTEDFVESKDPRGESYYWLTGDFVLESNDEGTDIWALKNGYVSVVPSMHDLTHYKAMDSIKELEDFI